MQALYQMDLAGKGINEIFAEFESHWIGQEVEGSQYLPAEAAFFREIVGGVVERQRELDPTIDAALTKGWPLRRIEALMRAMLRAGLYELEKRRDIPARVIVSEYVDVAHAFVDKDETGMINAVLQRTRAQRARRRVHAGPQSVMSARRSSRMSGEDRLIAEYFRPLATAPGAMGLRDDAAFFTPPDGHDLVLTKDALVAGVHFFADDPPDTIAQKALRVNLSDLAAKGAEPAGFLLALALDWDARRGVADGV